MDILSDQKYSSEPHNKIIKKNFNLDIGLFPTKKLLKNKL